ncbi:phosphatidate cytidylyltransferase [candidate division WOR-3 bacterium]|nr:phosphatidate cytidylyltransferase [candidate division WOR-3 bacterium]
MMKNELSCRVIPALFFIPILVFIAYFGGIYYLLLIELGIGIGAYEFYRILEIRGLKPFKSVGIIAALILGLNAYYASHLFTLLTLTGLFLFLSIFEISRRNPDRAIYHISSTIFGALYVGWFMSHLILLRQIPALIYQPPIIADLSKIKLIYFFPEIIFSPNYNRGIIYTLIPFVIAWLADAGAYLIGSKYGKHKILKRVSPGKSWEGCIAGGICGLIGIFILKYGWAPWLRVIDCLILGVIGATAAHIGDFVESMLKRDAQLKDVSNNIPGYGGVLDVFDSVLFVAPIVYYYLRFFVVK